MKYIILTLLVIAVCFAAGFFIQKLIKHKKKFGKAVSVLLTVVFGLGFSVAVLLIYFGIFYHARASAYAYLESRGSVTVMRTDGGWLFDGPGEEAGFIFYPGGKVEAEAYAPLMNRIAEDGADCFLVVFPFHFAIFGADKAGDIMASYDYDRWYLAGHSLGGVTAAAYAAKNPDDVTGIILLASYSTKKLDEGMKVLSIYGSLDQCLEMGAYQANKENLPDGFTEIIIDGGNHSQFGDYGEQDGDGKAAISAETQQEQTAEAVSDYING